MRPPGVCFNEHPASRTLGRSIRTSGEIRYPLRTPAWSQPPTKRGFRSLSLGLRTRSDATSYLWWLGCLALVTRHWPGLNHPPHLILWWFVPAAPYQAGLRSLSLGLRTRGDGTSYPLWLGMPGPCHTTLAWSQSPATSDTLVVCAFGTLPSGVSLPIPRASHQR